MNGVIKFLSLFLIIHSLFSCQKQDQIPLTLNFQKDLIPEGITIDTKTQTIFLNSLKHGKIMRCNIDGSNPKDFITDNQYGYLSGFGMFVKGDTLYALGNSLSKKNSKSILLLLNAKTGHFINSFSPKDTTFKYLNDLAVASNGDVFITDSESNKIYTVQAQKAVLEVYLETNEVKSSNGITISDDGKYLYLASNKKGICIVERQTKRIINQPNQDYTGIDGLKFYKNSLIGIVNAKKGNENGIYRYFLNKENTKITRKEKFFSFKDESIISTTFSISNGYMYFVLNTQLDNLDSESGQIIDENKLETYQLMKFWIGD
jgi:SMP-30/Gluconolactonase/LRE-like region